MDIALHRAGATIVEDRSGITGNDGASHNGMWDLALAGTVPGLRLAAPRDAATLREELREALQVEDGPTIVRYPKGSLPEPLPAWKRAHGCDVLWESAEFVDPTTQTREPNDSSSRPQNLLIVATGAFAHLGVEVAKGLDASNDLAVRVVDPRWLIPVPADLVAAAGAYDWVVTLEDGLVEGGFGSQLRNAAAAVDIFTPVLSYGIPRQFLHHATRDEIRKELGLTPQALVDSINSRI